MRIRLSLYMPRRKIQQTLEENEEYQSIQGERNVEYQRQLRQTNTDNKQFKPDFQNLLNAILRID